MIVVYSSVIDSAQNYGSVIDSFLSIVRFFRGIASIMDSSFNTLYTSFNTTLFVADEFIQVCALLGRLNSFIASFRLVKWFIKTIVFLSSM